MTARTTADNGKKYDELYGTLTPDVTAEAKRRAAQRRSRHRKAQAEGRKRICSRGIHDMYAGELMFTPSGNVRCPECKKISRRKDGLASLPPVEHAIGFRELFPDGIRRLWLTGALNWHDQGRCKTNPEVFYAPDAKDMAEFHRRNKEAKKICAWCPVRAQCLKYALDAEEEHGVWGGTTPAERKRILEKRKLERQVA